MTAYTFDKSPVLAKDMPSGVLGVMGIFELTGALADNDTIGDIPLPKGARILGARGVSTELDTNASPTLTLNLGVFGNGSDGTEDDEDNLIDGMTTGAATNIQEINVSTIASNVITAGAGFKITGDNAVARFTVDGAPATAATTGHVIGVIYYTLDAI